MVWFGNPFIGCNHQSAAWLNHQIVCWGPPSESEHPYQKNKLCRACPRDRAYRHLARWTRPYTEGKQSSEGCFHAAPRSEERRVGKECRARVAEEEEKE